MLGMYELIAVPNSLIAARFVRNAEWKTHVHTWVGPVINPKSSKDVFLEEGRVISENKRPLPGMPQVDDRAGGHLYPFPI